MKNTLIHPDVVKATMNNFDLTDLNKGSIRQIGGIVKSIEKETGEEFVHFEMGVPGLKPCQIGVDAERAALDAGIASIYPEVAGIPELKHEASRFFKAFSDIDISPECCLPTVGSMQGAFATFTILNQLSTKKDTVLFIDPGFSVQKSQAEVVGIKSLSFDLSEARSEKLGPKLERIISQGHIAAIVYSNPNNPTWMCLSEGELKTIGELATKYDIIVVEDLAYMAMDFRQDLGVPFKEPFQPSVAKYTDNFIILMSASKIFSYAGQRIAILAISNKIFNKNYEGLKERYGMTKFGSALVQRVLYCLSSGTAHTPQYALAAMLKAANDGVYNFVEEVREYGKRTVKLKDIFLRNGFYVIYDKDDQEPLSDGFYFTVGYKEIEGGELLRLLFHYGVSAIVLSTTGSSKQGLRICSSAIKPHHYDMLEDRLCRFNEAFSNQ